MIKDEDSQPIDKVRPISGLARRVHPGSSVRALALFVVLIEAIATVSLKFLLDANSPFIGHIVFFIMGFPLLFVVLIFSTLWMNRD